MRIKHRHTLNAVGICRSYPRKPLAYLALAAGMHVGHLVGIYEIGSAHDGATRSHGCRKMLRFAEHGCIVGVAVAVVPRRKFHEVERQFAKSP